MSSVYEREKRGKARGIVEIVAQTTSPDYKLRRTVIPASHITAKRKRSKVDKTKRERERESSTDAAKFSSRVRERFFPSFDGRLLNDSNVFSRWRN